jgi:hypothetical protein
MGVSFGEKESRNRVHASPCVRDDLSFVEQFCLLRGVVRNLGTPLRDMSRVADGILQEKEAYRDEL